MNIGKFLFESLGLKRKATAFLTTLMGIVSMHPELGFVVPYILHIAGLLGIAGIGGGVAAKNISETKHISLASALTILLLVAQYIPALQVYVPLLQQIAVLFGASVVGATVREKALLQEIRGRQL